MPSETERLAHEHPHGVARHEVQRTSQEIDGSCIELITLVNANGLEMRFSNFGGIIVSLMVPDRNGVMADVVLGYDTLPEYFTDPYYFGALIGRNANRIARGAFSLDGFQYQLATNEGANHLHGGVRGFNAVVWNVEPFDNDEGVGATLAYTSPAGEEGYPGTLRTRVTYALNHRDELIVAYRAETDQATPVNLTQHTYFNLSGERGRDVLDHELTLHASQYTPVNAELIPTGEVRRVSGTPFDFRQPQRIGAMINAEDDQLWHGGGYDHNFVLDGCRENEPLPAAALYDPHSGRLLEVSTSEPGMQVCSANALHEGVTGKGNVVYGWYSGIALETQHFPDSPGRPEFPSTIVRPGEIYTSKTIYRFSNIPG